MKKKIKVYAKEDAITTNLDGTKVHSEVFEDEIIEAILEEEVEEYFGKDSKGRRVYVGCLDQLGKLHLENEFVLIKED
ncbi:hypothetical protein QO179_24355 [Bacillus stercoris]|nr:hypothetical protein [Bacillus stercoris]